MPAKYTNKLDSKRVLVLGGTSGIGFCVAENALENGAIVIVASSQQSSIDKTLSRLHESYPDLKSNVSGHTIDLRSDDAENSIVELLKFATNNGKNLLDHIVNTAGDSLPLRPVAEFEGAETLLSAQRVRTMASIFIAKHAPEKYLHKSPRSSITFTGGVNSYRPGSNWALPALGGAGLQGLVRALAVELRPVRVNLVEPGAIETELFQKAFSPEQLEGYKQMFKTQSLVGLLGTPEDMSEAYLYVMRDGYMTGMSICSEGGLLLATGAQR